MITKAKYEKALDAALEKRIDAAFAVLSQGLAGAAGMAGDQVETIKRTYAKTVKGLMDAHAAALEATTKLFEKPSEK